MIYFDIITLAGTAAALFTANATWILARIKTP